MRDKSSRDHRERYDDPVAKDWKPELRMDLHGLTCADIRGNTGEREVIEDPHSLPLTDSELAAYYHKLMGGRLPRNYWRHVAKAGGCQSKMHATLVHLWMCCDRNGVPYMNGNDVPVGRTWRKVAQLMNQIATSNRQAYAPPEAETWDKTRAQQLTYEGLARMVVMDAWRGGVIVNRSLDDVYKDVYRMLWVVLKRKRKAQKSEPKLETQTFVRYQACCPGRREEVTITRPPIDWNAKRKAARKRGWTPPPLED